MTYYNISLTAITIPLPATTIIPTQLYHHMTYYNISLTAITLPLPAATIIPLQLYHHMTYYNISLTAITTPLPATTIMPVLPPAPYPGAEAQNLASVVFGPLLYM